MHRSTFAAAVALVLALVCAAPAAADNIVYAGSDGNVWISSVDGATKRKVTTDGTAQTPYRSPTQADSGKILTFRDRFFYVYNQDGTLATAPWQAPTGGSFYKQPINAQIAHNGGLITWWYIHNTWVSDPIVQRVSFQTADGGTPSPCTINCHNGWHDSRWIPGTPFAGMISTDGSTIGVQQQGASTPVAWAQTDGDFEGFDVSRAGNKIAIIATEDGVPAQGQHQQGVLQFFQGQGAPPAGASLVCQAAIGDETSEPRWSPNGTGLTWSDSQGVWVSNAPSAGAGCNLQPRLLAAGAKSPDWGPANVPAEPSPGPRPDPDPDPDPEPGPDPDPSPGPDPDPDPNPNPDPGPGPGPSPDPGPGPNPEPGPGPGPGPGPNPDPQPDRNAPLLTGVSIPKTKIGTTLSKGYRVGFETSEAGTATLKIVASGSSAKGLRISMARTAVVAGGTVRAPSAGRYTVVARFSKKAKARLRRLRSVKLTATLTIADAAGNTATTNRKLTLKR